VNSGKTDQETRSEWAAWLAVKGYRKQAYRF